MADGDPTCTCGHTAHWHGADDGRRMGWGSCEHDGRCKCNGYRPAYEDVEEALFRAPERDWHFLSFAGEHEFLGGAYVHCSTMQAALMRSHLLGINPGGSVQCIGPIEHRHILANVPEGHRERLLTADEILAEG